MFRLDFNKKETVTLSASHLQKLKLTFELTLPSGAPFKAQQVVELTQLYIFISWVPSFRL